MTKFILMLTHNDVTVSNALDVLEQVKNTGVKFVGWKDIGLSNREFEQLSERAKKYGMTIFLEIVTPNREEHFRGLELGLRLGVDYIIGGMPKFSVESLSYLRERSPDVRFFPYVGQVVGLPCNLEGNIQTMVDESAKMKEL